MPIEMMTRRGPQPPRRDGPPPTILQTSHVERAMSDPNFFTAMPEFLPVKKRAESTVQLHKGCNTCAKRRLRQQSGSDFVRIMNSLPDSALQRLKRYFGFQRMLVRAIDPVTRNLVYREI